MTERRTLLAGGGMLALLTLVGCTGETPPPVVPAGPAMATISATGAAGMNPGPDGADRPLTLTVLQLRGTQAFQGADFFALQAPAAALGGDLVSATQIALAPGGTGSAAFELDPATTAIAFVGGYRDPAGKAFRAVVPVQPGSSVNLAVGVTAAGVTARAA